MSKWIGFVASCLICFSGHASIDSSLEDNMKSAPSYAFEAFTLPEAAKLNKKIEDFKVFTAKTMNFDEGLTFDLYLDSASEVSKKVLPEILKHPSPVLRMRAYISMLQVFYEPTLYRMVYNMTLEREVGLASSVYDLAVQTIKNVKITDQEREKFMANLNEMTKQEQSSLYYTDMEQAARLFLKYSSYFECLPKGTARAVGLYKDYIKGCLTPSYTACAVIFAVGLLAYL